ncbi:hypothetical protein ACFL4Y_01595 [Gemmatimonadota bacterium]
MLRGEAWPEPVDLESLIAQSLNHLTGDARLFWCLASWLSVHHELVNTRRLGKILDKLGTADSALAGVLLEIARIESPEATSLVHLQGHCRRLDDEQVLFKTIEKLAGYERVFEDQWLEEFRRWGFLHYQWTDKRDAIRPVTWILRHVPELRMRAILGAGQEAEILEMALRQPVTVTQISRVLEYTYAASHSAAGRLLRRGLMKREEEGKHVFLRPHEVVQNWFESFPKANPA